ncbi:hypothetical protein [Paludibacter sp. 221]|uniref:hypothetical protein n=1 Tax=Paludibacter sp. 221 TaxID=2302939 RepID=UPI0013D6284F|nr:hypothetical protein [Paludibacter sp. 221]
MLKLLRFIPENKVSFSQINPYAAARLYRVAFQSPFSPYHAKDSRGSGASLCHWAEIKRAYSP